VTSCDAIKYQCNKTCTDVGTAKNCGGCGMVCSAPPNGTPTCNSAKCDVVCNSGLSYCNYGCVNLKTDPYNCGSCSNKCVPPSNGAVRCQDGACSAATCLTGLTLCGNDCIDLATDLHHCGACNAACSSGLCVGGQCNANLPRILLSAANIGPIAFDSTTVFYFDVAAEQIRGIPKTGGSPVTLATGQQGVKSITRDATHVYWASAGQSSIRRVPKVGGSLGFIATALQPGPIAVDDTYVYWARQSNICHAGC